MFDKSMDGLGGWCSGERDSWWIDKGDGRGGKFRLNRVL